LNVSRLSIEWFVLAARLGGGPKFLKVGHVTPSRPVNRRSPVTRYLDSSTPICLFTI